MPYGLAKRVSNDKKTSPLKVVSPIIRKYDGHRQKRIKISREIELENDKTLASTKSLKAILPHPTENCELISLEPELLSVVNPSSSSTVVQNNLANECLQPVQEICAIARLTAVEKKLCAAKANKPPRKRAGSSSVVSKKKLLKHGKMIESALELLRPEAQSAINAREEAYVSNYFINLKSTLPANQFTQFCAILEKLETSECKFANVFKELTALLAPYPDLLEDLIPFLTPEQALECDVFMEHLTLTKMTDFLILLDTHFAKTPYQIKRILGAFEKLALQPGVIGVKEVTSVIIPMLKGHPVLIDFFLELMPGCRPSDALRTDFDELDEDALSDGSDEGGESWERLEVPSVPDPYGGDTCICKCHDGEDAKFRSRAQHCVPCSTKFINGKVFIQSGKFLRRAQVTFTNRDMDFHRKRLFPGPVEPRKRKRSSSHYKDSMSPTKTHLSSDELRSDEDDKTKLKARSHRNKATKKTNSKNTENVENNAPKPGKVVDNIIKIEGEVTFMDIVKEEELVKCNYPEKAKEEKDGDCDTVTFMTVSEARQAAEARAIKANEKTKSLVDDQLKVADSVIVMEVNDLKIEVSANRQSPPVLSIPETATNCPGVDPLLSVLEEQTIKTEPVEESSESEEVQETEEVPWKMEEDKVILQTLQIERYCEETFSKISEALPSRSVDDIKKRFQALLNILYKMKAES